MCPSTAHCSTSVPDGLAARRTQAVAVSVGVGVYVYVLRTGVYAEMLRGGSAESGLRIQDTKSFCKVEARVLAIPVHSTVLLSLSLNVVDR